MISKYWYQFFLLLFLNLADFAFTRPLVNLIGPDAEANPITKAMIVSGGVTQILTMKLAVLGVLAVLLLIADYCGKPLQRITKWLTYTNIVYLVVVGWGLVLLMNTLR